MPVRAVWRPPWYAWAVVWLAALAFTHKVAPARLHGHWLILTPVLVLVGVLIVRKLWQTPPAVAMCGAIVLTIFSGAWHRIGLGGLPFDRLLIVVVLLQFLLHAPGVAHVPRLQIRAVHLLLGVVIAYVVVSALAAGTLTKEAPLLDLVDKLGVTPYLAFLVAPSVFSSRRERNLLLATLVGLGVYLGLTAIFESLGPHALVFPRYILHADVELPGERAGGPFQSSVTEGFGTFACAVAAVMAFTRWGGWQRRLAAVSVAVCAFGCFLTLERGIWIGAILGTVAAALVTRAGRRWLAPGALACALAVGAALVISPALAHKTSTRVNEQLSVWNRQNQTSAGLRMTAAKPLTGFGWGRYERDSPPYFRQSSSYPLDGVSTPSKPWPLHDAYLSYAVELGLIGALLWLTALIWGFGEAIFSRGPVDLRQWKLGLLAIVVFFLFVSVANPPQQPFVVLLLWVWSGVALGSTPLLVRDRREAAVRLIGDAVWTPA